jgi:hypothetical protein
MDKAIPNELMFPDWRKRLAKAKQEAAAGKTVELEAYATQRTRRSKRRS